MSQASVPSPPARQRLASPGSNQVVPRVLLARFVTAIKGVNSTTSPIRDVPDSVDLILRKAAAPFTVL